jgi:hypothetical protein
MLVCRGDERKEEREKGVEWEEGEREREKMG